MFPIIQPDWPAPSHVHALTTTRVGGVSQAPYDTFNLAMHVKDDPRDVAHNRALLRQIIPSEPYWLAQAHTTLIVKAGSDAIPPQADASYTREANRVCAVLTADCLPILVCDKKGSIVSAIHAGWRGLAMGILSITLDKLGILPQETYVWLGPAIGPQAFELREDVREMFLSNNRAEPAHFAPYQDRYLGDMYAIARSQCAKRGITQVYGGDLCTVSEPTRFYSFRRDGETGRMATLIWREDA